jgi:gluconolactonase
VGTQDRAEPVVVLRSSKSASLANLAFGLPNRSPLYATEFTHGHVLRAALDAPGLVLHRPQAR